MSPRSLNLHNGYDVGLWRPGWKTGSSHVNPRTVATGMTSISLSFPVCKMGTMLVPFPRVVAKTEGMMTKGRPSAWHTGGSTKGSCCPRARGCISCQMGPQPEAPRKPESRPQPPAARGSQARERPPGDPGSIRLKKASRRLRENGAFGNAGAFLLEGV